jgi:hypothetical protein
VGTSRIRAQGRNVEYVDDSRAETSSVKYGKDDVLASDVDNDSSVNGETVKDALQDLQSQIVTPYVADPSGNPYTLQEALTAAGAAASDTRWQTVFARAGQYAEGDVTMPPFVRPVGQSWLIGGLDCSEEGERAIVNFGIQRLVGDPNPCLDLRTSGSSDLFVDNLNVRHEDAASAVILEGIGAGFASLQAIRSLFYGDTGSATPMMDVRDRSLLDAKSCWLWISESGASQKVLKVSYNTILEMCNIIGQTEVTSAGALSDLVCTYQSLFSSAMDIAAGGWDGQFLPSFFSGSGNDITGSGDIFGCGALWGWGLSIAGTLNIVDDGGRVVYDPTTPGNWGSSIPDRMRDAFDTLAANVVIP